jgi:RNA-dependent RNA polymerase
MRHIVLATQVRFGGCKGVLALHPPLTGRRICYRPSMRKFKSDHTNVEVCSVARAIPCYLNRHVILLMSHNGVGGDVFLALQGDMVRKLDRMVVDRQAAALLLPRLGGVPSWCVSTLLEMALGGWEPKKETFLGQCLEAVRKHHLMELKAKSRVLVPEGKQLMGVMDEFGVLQPGEVFLQLGVGPNAARVITASFCCTFSANWVA